MFNWALNMPVTSERINADVLLVQSLNMFKVNIKDTKTTPLTGKCRMGCRPIDIDPIWYLFKHFLVIS